MIKALRKCAIVFLALASGWLTLPEPPRLAHADAKCAAACNAAHDSCMASSNDRYACDSQRNQCLKSCGGY